MLSMHNFDDVPSKILDRQIGIFATFQDAKEFIRKQLHKDGYNWKTVNEIMQSDLENPYSIYEDVVYDNEDGFLIESNAYIVYLK